ncbi:nitrous oxidase accessory protein [Zymobacter palmae]|uniref:Nitrous oxidase accessory protein n=1 Tax=Zymobacter palmae TaxID=33074 RepID=A0A348HID6_9GAMM|nr:nitrous oxidase accessory protein [Zymobacter palmae]
MDTSKLSPADASCPSVEPMGSRARDPKPSLESLRQQLLGCVFQCFYSWKNFAFDVFKECAAASRNVRHLVCNAVFVDSGQRVTTTCDGERFAFCNRFGQCFGTFCELVDFEYADRTVPQDGASAFQSVSESSGRFRTYVQNQVVISNVGNVFDSCFGFVGELFGYDNIDRYRDVDFAHQVLSSIDQISFVQGFAHVVASRCDEGVGNTTADDDGVAFFGQRVQHFQFGGYFGTTNDSHHRAFRFSQRFVQSVQLGFEQRTCNGFRRETSYAMSRSLGAVSGTESVHDEDVTLASVFLGQRFIVFFLAFVEANVFEQDDVAIVQFDFLVEVVFFQTNLNAEQFAQAVSNRCHGRSFIRFAFSRAAQVAHQHQFGASVVGHFDGFEACANTRVRSDTTVFDRNVQVFTDQDAFSFEVQLGHLAHCHGNSSCMYEIGNSKVFRQVAATT